MTEQLSAGRTAPGSYWVVAVLGLLWNSFGAYDYAMTEFRVASYLAQFPADIVQRIAAMPAWAIALWALGVWGSFFGSVAMLLRSSWASLAFLVSLIAALLSFSYQYSIGMMTSLVLPLVICGAVLFFWWYCRRSARLGYLR